MIYEIFKSLAENGLSWMEWCGGVVVSLYLIHILCLILSWCASWCYGYVHDWAKEKASCYVGLIERLVREKSESLKVNDYSFFRKPPADFRKLNIHERAMRRRSGDLLNWDNGVYKVDAHFAYWKVEEGVVTHFTDLDYQILSTTVSATLSKTSTLLWIGPLIVALTLLFFDTYPVAAASIAITYGVLRTARGLVRTMKRVDKLEADTPEAT